MGDKEDDCEDYTTDVRTKDLLVVHIPELKVSALFIGSYLTMFVIFVGSS